MAGGTADQGPQARQHLFHLKGLGHVIVGAGIEARDLLAPAPARGEEQHRHGAPGAPPALEHRQPVDDGQAEVEDDGVIGLGIAEEMALLAVGREVDGVAGVTERRLELARQVGIIFDDEDAHYAASVYLRAHPSPCPSLHSR